MASSLATIPFCLAQWPSLGLRKKKEWSNHVYLCTQWDHVTFLGNTNDYCCYSLNNVGDLKLLTGTA